MPATPAQLRKVGYGLAAVQGRVRLFSSGSSDAVVFPGKIAKSSDAGRTISDADIMLGRGWTGCHQRIATRQELAPNSLNPISATRRRRVKKRPVIAAPDAIGFRDARDMPGVEVNRQLVGREPLRLQNFVAVAAPAE